MRLTDKRVALIAISDAIDYNQELLDGTPRSDPNFSHVQGIIAAMRRLNAKISGGTLTIRELIHADVMDNTKNVSIREVSKMIDSGEMVAAPMSTPPRTPR
jgi:predicted transcriptional regulator